MLANYHTHTIRCNHATGEDREYVEAAIRAGMKVLGFSEHCPWVYDDDYVSRFRMLPQDLDDYFDSILTLRREYSDEITIYIGLEGEYLPELMEAQTALLKDYPIDYMILGQHYIKREPSLGMLAPIDDETILRKYVDLIIEGLETGKYQYVAHPDFINYVGPDQIYSYHMQRLCDCLKKKNIPVEINMRGFMDNKNYPSERFLSIANKTGNSVIIGVDAHSPECLEDINMQNKCLALAEKCGLPLIDYLHNLKPAN
jgi:histidinol-phosphatase (PHP family)